MLVETGVGAPLRMRRAAYDRVAAGSGCPSGAPALRPGVAEWPRPGATGAGAILRKRLADYARAAAE